jgi:lysophospholipase L1-like esterase
MKNLNNSEKDLRGLRQDWTFWDPANNIGWWAHRIAVAGACAASLAGGVLLQKYFPVGHWVRPPVKTDPKSEVRPNVESRRALYESLPTQPPGRTVFLGDSLVEWASWDERWPGGAIARGVSGARVREIRRSVGEVARHRPATVVLMCGANDLLMRTSTGEQVAVEIAELVQALLAESTAQIRVCSLLPVSITRKNGLKENAEVREANTRLAALTDGGRVEFVDVWHSVVDAEGGLRANLTCDGVHLNEAGYRAWLAALQAEPPR